eukprot:6189092-Pleurochrysis_carterae.AAC.7
MQILQERVKSLRLELLHLADKRVEVSRCQHTGQPVHVGQLQHPLLILGMLLHMRLVEPVRSVQHWVNAADLSLLGDLLHLIVG